MEKYWTKNSINSQETPKGNRKATMKTKPIFLIFIALFLSCSTDKVPKFNGEDAFKILVKQCEFGPRVPNTAAHDSCLAYFKSYLKSVDLTPKLQHFTSLGYKGEFLSLTNVIVEIPGKSKDKVLLCAHWDSRPRSDQDTIANWQTTPTPGANDGASGVAVLLELSKLLAKNKPKQTVIIALFDGEDYGVEKDYANYLLGSKYYAQSLKPPLPIWGILLDMIGDSSLQIYKEGNSQRYASSWQDSIFKTAISLGYSEEFIDSINHYMIDDHLPLNQAGIPTVDLIDFDYPHWHTTTDTPDKCSPHSLEIIGNLLVKLVY